MLYLLLSVLCSVLIANFLMLMGRRGQISMLPVFLGNYFIASLSSYLTMPRLVPTTAFDLGFGIITGALFLGNFWVYQKCIACNGLSLSVGVMRIAMIVPVLMAVVWFREQLGVLNGLGIVLGLAAFTLKSDPKALHNFLWIVGLFAISGLTDASLKIFKELGSGNEAGFVYIIFTSAFVFTLLLILAGRIRFTWQSIVLGCLLGIPNRYSTVFFLKGLDSIPAALAYPIVAVSIVLLSIVSDLAIWHKQASRRDVLLWALLLVSLVLLNL